MYKGLCEDIKRGNEKIAVVGLGYVGLPIAITFSRQVKTIGFDTNKEKINQYRMGIDPTNEVGDEEVKNTQVEFTDDENLIRESKFIIIAVPTPVNSDKTPDLTPVMNACEIIGRNLTRGSIVVLESTVFPGVTEDICIPILEKTSGLSCGIDFKVGYSPERINPGDKKYKLNNIVKIVSGMDEITTDIVAKIYELIIDVGVHRASNIKVAEAAKLAENAQRDINIAYMNELAIVFEKMDINTIEVIEAMNTKWNALGFTPGLVGGHCIGVDPYYFIYQAEKLGYHSQIILSGRKINDYMSEFIADITIKRLIKANKMVKAAKVYIMGITFKENCPDIRNSKVVNLIKRLNEYDVHAVVVDPVANREEIMNQYEIEIIDMEDVKDADCIIFTVGHDEFKNLSTEYIDQMFLDIPRSEKVIVDIKGIFAKREFIKKGYSYWSL